MDREKTEQKKVLFVAKVAKGHILTFHIPYLKMLKEMGCEVHVATGDEAEIPYCDVKYTVPIKSFPLSIDNFKAYRELKKIIEKERYDLIHTHTSMGGAIGRLSAIQARKKGTIVMHTAHGFAFYKGAPLISGTIYYLIEKFCSYFTDCMITMNAEDYKVSSRKLKAKNNFFVNGVGVDIKSIQNTSIDKINKKQEMGLKPDTVLILSVGGLRTGKNHATGIRAIKMLVEKEIRNIHYMICGEGEIEKHLLALVDKLELNEYVTFTGFRQEVREIMLYSDIFLFPSIYEGLPVSVIEAMAAGLPVVCSKIRGNVDLISDYEGGVLIGVNEVEAYAFAIGKLVKDKELREKMGYQNKLNAFKYDIDRVSNEIRDIYIGYLQMKKHKAI